MGASGYSDRIDVIVDVDEFYSRVGMIASYLELSWLGLETDLCFSFFWGHQIQRLLHFCFENPEYHIVSSNTPGRLVNRYLPDAQTYKLAKGDKNPNLVFNHFLSPKRTLVDEEVIGAALAILHHVKACKE